MATVTSDRTLVVETLDGARNWAVTEFADGWVLLTVRLIGLQFEAHFTREQWTEFQRLVGGRS